MHASDISILARGRLEVWPRGLALRPPWLCGTRALTAITMLTSFHLAAAEFREPQWCDVFTTGQEGYPAYRIPALLATRQGNLLAFAEGRAQPRDHAENDIVLKRSSNQGRTWSALQVVAEDSTNALNNPTAVQLRENGRVLLVYQRYAKGFDEHRAEPGLQGARICRTFMTQSDDEGVTWRRPRDITVGVKRPQLVTSTAAGPGIGIQLRAGPRAGRVLIPFNQGPYGQWKVYAVYSDDGGQSWRYGDTAPDTSQGFANEVQFVELHDGAVMLNARNQNGVKLRKMGVSRDGGETWARLREDPALPEPACQASILRHPTGRNAGLDVFLFSNPASPWARTNGTIRLSRDEGKSWPIARVLYPGSFAYSCLTSLPDGSVGCLFERDDYKKITFARFTLEWLSGD